MSAWVIPAPLTKPVPRKVRMTGGTLTAILVSVIPVAFLWIYGYATLFAPEHRMRMLEKRGVDIAGRVVEVEASGGSGRGRHGSSIDYTYAPTERNGWPVRTMHGKSIISEQDYRKLHVRDVVQLIYDPLHPDEVELKGKVEAHRLQRGLPKWLLVPLLGGVFLSGVVALLLSIVLYFYHRARQAGEGDDPAAVRRDVKGLHYVQGHLHIPGRSRRKLDGTRNRPARENRRSTSKPRLHRGPDRRIRPQKQRKQHALSRHRGEAGGMITRSDHDRGPAKCASIPGWTPPPPLMRATPREVKMVGHWLAIAWVVAIAFSLPLAGICGMFLDARHEMEMLATRGVDISGTVVAKQPAVSGGRNDHGPLVDYIYEPRELAGKPDHVVHKERVVSDPDYRAAQIGGSVALVYDPLRSETSDYKDRVEAARHGRAPPSGSILPLLMIVMPAGAIISVIVWCYLREKQLLQWGKFAQATIISEVEYQGRGRYPRMHTRVVYTFEDDSGAVIQGEQSGLPARDDDLDRFYRDRDSFLGNPTALYDPDDSERNILFPGSFARLR